MDGEESSGGRREEGTSLTKLDSAFHSKVLRGAEEKEILLRRNAFPFEMASAPTMINRIIICHDDEKKRSGGEGGRR